MRGFTTSDGVKIAYFDEGTPRLGTLVFIHGGPGFNSSRSAGCAGAGAAFPKRRTDPGLGTRRGAGSNARSGALPGRLQARRAQRRAATTGTDFQRCQHSLLTPPYRPDPVRLISIIGKLPSSKPSDLRISPVPFSHVRQTAHRVRSGVQSDKQFYRAFPAAWRMAG